MANPGSPDSMKNSMEGIPPMSKTTLLGMLFTLGLMFVLLRFRAEVGKYLNYVFQYVDFGGLYPVTTLILMGLIMTSLSSIIRSLLTDPLKMARSQHIQKEFNAEMRKARMENNLYKLKKLGEQQPQMMAASMESSQDQMKIMPLTMVIVIPIYTWVWYFIENTAVSTIINVPWAVVNLTQSFVLPVWILIYTLISIPIGQLINKIIRYLLLSRRLAELDAEERQATV